MPHLEALFKTSVEHLVHIFIAIKLNFDGEPRTIPFLLKRLLDMVYPW